MRSLQTVDKLGVGCYIGISWSSRHTNYLVCPSQIRTSSKSLLHGTDLSKETSCFSINDAVAFSPGLNVIRLNPASSRIGLTREATTLESDLGMFFTAGNLLDSVKFPFG